MHNSGIVTGEDIANLASMKIRSDLCRLPPRMGLARQDTHPVNLTPSPDRPTAHPAVRNCIATNPRTGVHTIASLIAFAVFTPFPIWTGS